MRLYHRHRPVGRARAKPCGAEDLNISAWTTSCPPLLPSFAAMRARRTALDKVAVVVDIRGGAFFQDAFNAPCAS